MDIAMRKCWTELLAVFAVIAMLQGLTFIGRALGEAQATEGTGGPESIAVEETEPSDLSAAPGQEAVTAETTVGSIRQSSYVFQPKVCSAYMEEVFGKAMYDALWEPDSEPVHSAIPFEIRNIQ